MANESRKPPTASSDEKGLEQTINPPPVIDPMRSFNRWCATIIGIFFLLIPWPLRGPELWIIGLVCVHAFLFAVWFYYRNVKQNFLAAVLRAGIFTYGISLLLIALQVRGWTQYLLMNPYFVAPRWNEIWVPVFCFVGMIYVALSYWLFVFLSRGNSRLGITLGLVLWACLLGLLGYYQETIESAHRDPHAMSLVQAWLPGLYFGGVICATFPFWIWVYLSRGSARRWMALGLVLLVCLMGLLGYYLETAESVFSQWTATASRRSFSGKTPNTATGYYDASYEQQASLQAKAIELFRWSCVESDGPSEAWVRELETLLQIDGGTFAVLRMMAIEPVMRRTVHRHWTQLYGLDGEIDSQLAWKTLERLGAEPCDYLSRFRMYYVVESVAEHLDSDQLIDQILATDVASWPPIKQTFPAPPKPRFYRQGLPEQDKLKPLLYAAWWLDQKQNALAPDEYNDFGNRIGRAVYCREQAEKNQAKFSIFRRKFCDGRDYDEYLRRKHFWSLGTDQKIGNATVKHSESMMIFHISKGGREWRRNNRDRLLELARKSIASAPEPEKKLSRGASLAFGALAASNSFGSPEPWPTPSHLGFLFSDPPIDQQPSLAFEFWPEFDKWISEHKKARADTKLGLRWNYLAKMWPESSTEMFVDCYMETPPESRQFLLMGAHLGTVGLPRTIPAEAQFKILESIKIRISESGEAIAKGYHEYSDRTIETKNEIETIDVAIALVECPEGAATFVNLLESRLGTKAPSHLFNIHSIKHVYNSHLFPPNYFDKRHKTYMERWLDIDCLTGMAKHKNPDIRRLAIEVIDMRPIQEYMESLELLEQDSDEEVRAAAERVAADLANLREKSNPAVVKL